MKDKHRIIDTILFVNSCIVIGAIVLLIVIMFIATNSDEFQKYDKLFTYVALATILLSFISYILSLVNPNRYK